MTPWKVKYDFARRFWSSYGHVLFVWADDEATALTLGRAAAQAAEATATITRVDVTPATEIAVARHQAKRAAQATWLKNIRTGTPNDPRAL
jgi:hypothetical protein